MADDEVLRALLADADVDASTADASFHSELASLSVDSLSSSSSLIDEDLWWMVDDDPAPSTAVASGGFSVSIHTPESTQAAASTRSSERVQSRSAVSRQRAKSELDHLRRRVCELEQQLEAARTQAMPESPVTTSPGMGNAVDQFWQRLAQSEREARQRAVTENLKLRGQLEAQLRTARSLEKLLNKRPLDVDAPAADSFKRFRVGGVENDDASSVYEALLADLDMRYLDTDTVLLESGLAQRRETFQDARVRFASKSSVDGAAPTPRTSSSCVEFVTAHVVPFEYEMTRDVSWRALQSPSIPLSNGVYEAVDTAERDVVKALFTIHTKLRGSDVISRARFVARQYIEENRTVVVWALASTIQGGALKNHRVELLEEGWSAISPLKASETDGATQLSLTQACGRLRPRMVVRAGSKLDELVGLLTDVFLDCYHDTQQGLYDFTGRMLLDEAMKRR